MFSDIGGKTRRPVWAFLLGDVLEHFLAFAPGATAEKSPNGLPRLASDIREHSSAFASGAFGSLGCQKVLSDIIAEKSPNGPPRLATDIREHFLALASGATGANAKSAVG